MKQAGMPGDVVGPVPRQSAPAFLAQSAPQLCQQVAMTLLGPVFDLVRP
jgi:hypothetical protein